jgi:4-alpha-glucanotransferase
MPTDRFGIDDRYHDALGALHETSPETRAALLAAMGVDAATIAETLQDRLRAKAAGAAAPSDAAAEPEPEPVRVLTPGASRALREPVELVLEDGSSRTADGELPADLPLGYHQMRARGGAESLLIVAPAACHLPDDLKTWGWAAQAYAARSRASWGIGDLDDLARLGRWTRGLGAGVVMVNPMSAATPVPPIEPSPYYPSSRRFRNPLFLAIERVPGFAALGADGVRWANAGRALNKKRRIDRGVVFQLKMEALDKLYAGFAPGGDADFERYVGAQGTALQEFATYCALSEKHGKDWRRWPAGYRRPDGADIRAFRDENAARVRFHAWLQWLVDGQLATAAKEIAVVNDLPIGIDIAGADAWCWQDLMASEVSVGAPPDEFSASGQDWGLTPFIPFKLRAAGYRPFVETIRGMLAHAGGLRIDHVMGLFRLFWIPRALGAKRGAYVRSRSDELLAIVALESQRAKAFIVGEDLGTVEDGVRETLAKQRMLSYRLMYFEPVPPQELPELALSSVTTHDLATLAGLWSGSDVKDQQSIGLTVNESGMKSLRDRIAKLGDLPDDAPTPLAIEKTYAALAAAPSRVLLATLDDALAVPERPNMPGTVSEWPNWSLALPQTLEEIEQAELPRKLAAALTRNRRAEGSTGEGK